jgi:hypothetical protein
VRTGVDHVLRPPPLEHVDHPLSDHGGRALERLLGGARDVWSENGVGSVSQRVIGNDRLLGERIDRRPGDQLAAQGSD